MKTLHVSISHPRLQSSSYLSRLMETPHLNKHLILRLIVRVIAKATEEEQDVMWLAPSLARLNLANHPTIRSLAERTGLTRLQVCGMLSDLPKEATSISCRVEDFDWRSVRQGEGNISLDAALSRVREGIWTELCLGVIGPQRIFAALDSSDRADRLVALDWWKSRSEWMTKYVSEDEVKVLTRIGGERTFVPISAMPQQVPPPASSGLFAGVERAVVDRNKTELPIVIEDEPAPAKPRPGGMFAGASQNPS